MVFIQEMQFIKISCDISLLQITDYINRLFNWQLQDPAKQNEAMPSA